VGLDLTLGRPESRPLGSRDHVVSVLLEYFPGARFWWHPERSGTSQSFQAKVRFRIPRRHSRSPWGKASRVCWWLEWLRLLSRVQSRRGGTGHQKLNWCCAERVRQPMTPFNV